MAFIRGFLGGFLRGSFDANDPFRVIEVRADDYAKRDILAREDCIVLYGPSVQDPPNAQFEIVLHRELGRPPPVSFRLFLAEENVEAEHVFILTRDKLPLLLSCCPNFCTQDGLQEICTLIKNKPTWTLAHLAAHMGLVDCLRSPEVQKLVNEVCIETCVTPLHIAVKAMHLPTVQYLMSLDPRLDIVDNEGNTVFHYAAASTKEIIQALSIRPVIAVINQRNSKGQTPLHLACLADKPDCVKGLIRAGADVNVTGLREAEDLVDYGEDDPMNPRSSAKDIIEKYTNQLETKDMKNGGTPLHWAKSCQVIEALLEVGCDINARNFQGDTALHIMISRGKFSCVMCLLSHDANVNLSGAEGNTSLHLAARLGDVCMVQALVVFGGDVNALNDRKETPRHIAASKKGSQHDLILYVLHSVGAARCSQDRGACNEGCSIHGAFNGVPPEKSPLSRQCQLYDDLVGKRVVEAALERKRKRRCSGDALMKQNEEDMMSNHTDAMEKRCRILALDGGGIRGLVLIQMLWCLEQVLQKPVIECFDWVAGTSTGGILALVLCVGKSISYCRSMYFRLKDKVFVGMRPYQAEPLEKFLQDELGENTVMSDIKRPKVMITGVLADRHPAELHLFRNYDSPQDILGRDSEHALFPSPPKPSEQLVWEAGRSSGAAPTYFRACGRFLDGGLIANNPTQDALTEIHHYNEALRCTHQEDKIVNPEVVVSLGTGKSPLISVPAIDVFRPDSLWGAAKIAFGGCALGQLLVDQASQADGRVVERAQAWCSMISVPYFRLSPPLSENVALDETADKVLVNMLWEVTAYMHSRRKQLEELSTLLL